MQQFFIFLALLFTSLMVGQTTEAQSNLNATKVTATVVNIGSESGTVYFGLYDRDSFMGKPLIAKAAAIENGQSTAVFEVSKKGYYAITCYHDANGNERMDFDEIGMPIENYGVSNNVMNLGPPNFEDGKFEVSEKDLFLEIKF